MPQVDLRLLRLVSERDALKKELTNTRKALGITRAMLAKAKAQHAASTKVVQPREQRPAG